MQCPNCGFDNPSEMKFCGDCAASLVGGCPKCGFANPARFKFCGECGSALSKVNDAVGPHENNGNVLSPSAPDSQISVTTTRDQSTSFAEGRYVVKRFLGEGGKKKVYLAHDELLDRDIAFALINLEGLDDVGRERITREAQAMGRLGSHPHIVTVLDLGDHEGQPYMVIEFLAGGDVEGLIDDAPDHKLPLEQAVKIAVETCRGLEFAHSRGIIHRDLKPGNVWLTADGTAKLGDFGLAVATDRSRLTQQGMMVGTVSYMPPEQAMGGEISPKADLYSLGAMLYEMVAGRPPFLGDDNIAIIGQHINTKAVAPTWHRSDCPRPLEALIMRLLSKNPDDRPENAEAVRLTLEAIDLSTSTRSQEQPIDLANVLEGLADDIFVGRQAEMDQLKAALEDALSGKGRMVTLVGEPGIGKTRTAQELATYAGLRGCLVLWGRCYEEQGVPPYWPWVQAMRSYVRDRNPEELRSDMGAGAAEIAEIVSEVNIQLPGLEPPAKLDSPEQARFRFFDSIMSFLKAASKRKPIVLVLDDLHWCDKPSLLLLEFLTRELSGARILVVGTYRDVELGRRHPLVETLGELSRQRLFERILLRGLSQQDVTRFIEVTSGITPPVTLARAVHTQTEGNPMFMIEVVRLLVQEGELTKQRVRERASWELRVPEGVREVIGRRLNRLSHQCNETLDVAAVVGREFTLQQLDSLTDDLDQNAVLDVLEEALTARLIEELPTSVGLYQFTHTLIQETLVDELSLTRRVRLHARIANTLEELYGVDAEAHAAELAHHFAQAEATLGSDSLIKYSLLAGEKALSNLAFEDANLHFERGLAAKDGMSMDSETADLIFGLSRSQFAILPRGRRGSAYENLKRVFEYSIKNEEISRALEIAQLVIPTEIGVPTGLDVLYEQALNHVPADSLSAGRILANYGRELATVNLDYERAQDVFAQGLEIAQREDAASLEMRLLSQSGGSDVLHCHFSDGLRKTLRAVDLARKLDDVAVLRTSSFNAVLACMSLGRLDESREHAANGLVAAERMNDRQVVIDAISATIWVDWCEGRWGSIRLATEKGLALVPQSLEMLAHRAIIEYEVGEPQTGDEYFDMFVLSFKSIGYGSQLLNTLAATAIAMAARIMRHDKQVDLCKQIASDVISWEAQLPIHELHCQIVLGLLATLEGDVTAAEKQYSLLRPWKGHATPAQSVISVDNLLGLLAQTIGNTKASQSHFEDAVAFCRTSGNRPELAWSLCDFADMLLERDGNGDQDKATEMLDQSLSITTELGLRPLMERVLSRRAILKA